MHGTDCHFRNGNTSENALSKIVLQTILEPNFEHTFLLIISCHTTSFQVLNKCIILAFFGYRFYGYRRAMSFLSRIKTVASFFIVLVSLQ